MRKEALIAKLREEAAHDLHHETIALLIEAADALAEQPAQQEPCKHCHGDGIDGEDGDGIVSGVTWPCEVCNGTGKALAQQPAQQEPVQRYSPDGEGGMEIDSLGAWVKFTSPPAQRTWVGLTDDDIVDGMPEGNTPMSLGEAFVKYGRAIEAKLKEKNT